MTRLPLAIALATLTASPASAQFQGRHRRGAAGSGRSDLHPWPCRHAGRLAGPTSPSRMARSSRSGARRRSRRTAPAKHGSSISRAWTVLPGLIDMHVHAVDAGLQARDCRFPQGADAATITRTVKGCVAAARPGEWITGGQWGLLFHGQDATPQAPARCGGAHDTGSAPRHQPAQRVGQFRRAQGRRDHARHAQSGGAG